MVEYRQAAEYMQRSGVRVSVPERSRRRGGGGTGVDAGADDHQPVGGAASHNLMVRPIGVILGYVGWKSATAARRHVGVTVYAAVTGLKRSCETASIQAGALPLSE